MSDELLEPVKPAVTIWVQPQAVLSMEKGYYPRHFYFQNPNPTKDSMDYVKIIVPFDVFSYIWKEHITLDSLTSDMKL
jgi:hypothetical protein